MALSQALRQTATPADPQRVRQAILRLQALPAFYPTIQKALRLLEDPLSSNIHVQQVISSDQAIAARILSLANSAYFGFYSRVHTVSLAITLIGREKVSTLLHRILAEELFQMLSGRKPAASQIRELSLITATAAHVLAERLLRQDKEEILIAGLLHNIGDLVLLSQFREHYEDMLRLADERPRAEAEVAVFGVESRIVGKWLLEAWNFPIFFPTVIEHYQDPWAFHFPAAPVSSIAIIHAARQIAECWVRRQKAEEVLRSVSQRLLSTLEVDRAFLADVYIHLPGEIERLKASLV